VDFCALAAASGYGDVQSLAQPNAVAAAIAAAFANAAGPVLIHAPTLSGVPDNLPRPSITPAEVGHRLRGFLQT
jgi:phosphonopyruvate decarboxylase